MVSARGITVTTPLVNFLTGDGAEHYTERAQNNIQFFTRLFGQQPRTWQEQLWLRKGRNWDRLQYLADRYKLDQGDVIGVNLGDEAINLNPYQMQSNLGCTSVARDGIIGQTLDLFTVELCIVREMGSLYLTFPPYLCVMGMNRNIAFCTNHLFAEVQGNGTPISHIRRGLLDTHSVEQALKYLNLVTATTSVNILLTDGKQTLDVELSPAGIQVHNPVDGTLAHTNHVLEGCFTQDLNCLRLARAARQLEQGWGVVETLEHDDIVQPITDEFGTIVTVVMDVRNGSFHWRDPNESWKQIQL